MLHSLWGKSVIPLRFMIWRLLWRENLFQVRSMLLSTLGLDGDSGQAYVLSPPAIDRLSEIRVPTLVIVGDLDMPEIKDLADILVRDIPGARKVTIPGVAHMVNMEKPEVFNQAVLDFLARLKLGESQ